MTESAESGGADDTGDASVRLSVPEMDCPSCAGKVDSSLARVDGIGEMELSVTTGTAEVSYDSERVSQADVVAAVEGAGYTVEAVADTGSDGATGPGRDAAGAGGPTGDGGSSGVEVAPTSAVWTSPRARKTWVGAVFVALGLVFEFLVGGEVILATLDVAIESVVPVAVVRTVTLADVLFLAAVALAGIPVVRDGYYSAKNRSLDIDLLMGTAILAATGIGYYVEAATLAVLFSIAEMLEEYAMDRARDSLRELLELSPDEATVVRDGEERTVPAGDVAVGETVVVRPGEKVPLDGTVTTGESAVDESPITGESVPVDKTAGDEVYAGAINEEGYLEVEVTSTAGDSTLARIIELVQGAEAERTETEQFVDRFASYYTPVVVVLAILTAAVPPVLIDGSATLGVGGAAVTLPGDWGTWFVRGLTFLVIACPCAFVISTPVSVVSGITSAAKNGVLIKGGTYLESMGEVDAVALDKTGTLTKGELAVTDLIPVGTDETDLLRVAAALESRSEHPIADAVRARAEDAGVDAPGVTDFESLTGKGVRAQIDGETYYAGKPALFEEMGFALSRRVSDGTRSDDVATDGGAVRGDPAGTDTVAETISTLEGDGKTVVLVGTDETLLGALGVADETRPEARQAVERLRELGVDRVVMLTGDNEGTARAIAEEAGVDEYRAELLPEEKVDAVETLRTDGSVAMVGDGINDAPALAAADVGVAMGAAGTDTAIETADVALMGDDLTKLPYLYALSNRANSVIRENIWASLGVKALLALGVPLGYVSVALAVVVGDMGMSLGVTGNAMRLSRLTPEWVWEG